MAAENSSQKAVTLSSQDRTYKIEGKVTVIVRGREA